MEIADNNNNNDSETPSAPSATAEPTAPRTRDVIKSSKEEVRLLEIRMAVEACLMPFINEESEKRDLLNPADDIYLAEKDNRLILYRIVNGVDVEVMPWNPCASLVCAYMCIDLMARRNVVIEITSSPPPDGRFYIHSTSGHVPGMVAAGTFTSLPYSICMFISRVLNDHAALGKVGKKLGVIIPPPSVHEFTKAADSYVDSLSDEEFAKFQNGTREERLKILSDAINALDPGADSSPERMESVLRESGINPDRSPSGRHR